MVLISPVVLKEIRTLMRSRKAFWLLLLLLLVAAAAFALAWVAMIESGGGSLSRRADTSRALFTTISAVMLIALGLISPIMTSTAITSERENKTIDLLFCTGITRLHLVFGKWLAAIGYQVTLVICMMPILALIFQLGGVALDEYLFTAILILTTIATYGMLGLACSASARRTPAALMRALLIVIFLGAFLPLAVVVGSEAFDWYDESAYIGGGFPGAGTSRLLSLLFWGTSPFFIWMTKAFLFASGGAPSSIGAIFADPIFRGHLIFQGSIFALSASIAWVRLAGLRRPRLRKAAAAPAPVRKKRIRRAPGPFPDGVNPVYLKEIRATGLTRFNFFIGLSYLFMLGCMAYGLSSARSFSSAMTIAASAVSFIMFFVPILGATGISAEREERTLDLLRVTMLTPRQIVYGKFFHAARALGVLSLSVLLLPILRPMLRPFFSDVSSSSFSIEYLLKVAVFLLTYAAFFAALTVFCSAHGRRNVTAIVSGFLTIFAILVLPYLLYSVGEIFGQFPGARSGSLPIGLLAALLALPTRFFLSVIAPIVNPYFYLAGLNERSGDFSHIFSNPDWSNWGTIAIHAAAVGATSYLLLGLAARRLGRERR